MPREPVDRQSLLTLVTDLVSQFPPQEDSDNARPFRLLGVDYLEGKITHPQFNLLYTKEKTAEQITDAIVGILNARQYRMPANPGRMGETALERWRLQHGKNLRRSLF